MDKIVIKNTKDRNRYLLTNSGWWVRDFTQSYSPIDINDLLNEHEYKLLINNEIEILSMMIPEVESEYLPKFDKVLIVCDGYKFKEKRHILNDIPKDVCIIAVNRALANWEIQASGSVKRKINYYLVNNPYLECMSYLPTHEYRPKCICSLRTNPKFIKKYNGQCLYYVPTINKKFGKKHKGVKTVDDYRNPICAAMTLSFRYKVKKLGLFCCDNVFDIPKPSAVKLSNDLWMYPQNQIAHELIDGLAYWLQQIEQPKIEVVNYSSNTEYKFIKYIDENNLVEFFR